MTLEAVDAALIDSVCTRLHDQLAEDDARLAEAFVRQYYRWASPEDLAERTPLNLYGAAVAHLELARTRRPGTARVRVYNPTAESDGWTSTHTAVEIVTDDLPFLIDSVGMELNRQGFGIHLIIHPVMSLRRDAEGRLREVLPFDAVPGEGFAPESVIHAEVDRQTDAARLEALRAALMRVLGEVRATVEDWPRMRARALEVAAELDAGSLPVDPADVEETKAFLAWLEDHHFTFLGYRQYDVEDVGGRAWVTAVAGSGLGILRQPVGKRSRHALDDLTPRVRELALAPNLLTLTKANSRATVHRPSYMDYVGIKRFDQDGLVVGEHRFLGLYTTGAYHANPRDIPVLRRKVDAVLSRAAFPPGSHNEKALIEILEIHPRDELFQIAVDELFETAIGILHLGERQRVRLFVRADRFGRFLSCLVFVPRDRFNTDNRRRIERILAEAFGARAIDYTTRVSESVLVRLHYAIDIDPTRTPEYDLREIEARLVAATRSWADDLHAALIEQHGEEHGNALRRTYGDAFPTGYRADWEAHLAVADIGGIETLADHGGLVMTVYRPGEAAPGEFRAKLLHAGAPLALSDMLPIFENMGVAVADERPYEVTPRDQAPVWIYDFGLTYQGELDDEHLPRAFHDVFIRTWRGEVENDGFNRLVLGARLDWREITVLRAVARYLRQAGTTFSDHYVERALVAHPEVARLLVELFCARFDPHGSGDRSTPRTVKRIEDAIDAVESLDQDRILRHFLSIVEAILRTNYFQRRDADDSERRLSFKLDPGRIPFLPRPLPQFEIFVYSPRTEGVHLRGGKVARGGIRWSDRREDFRTEVLGLMKAQMVKNAVIVPVGAKGGFVIKRPPPTGDRGALLSEVLGSYRTFIRGLLDVTDNIVGGAVRPPPQVIRRDEDDPYLVVAADKGTATMSDVANAIAYEYGLWLGDAFASGGSTGYDHKTMGITARGAWESVKRHFRELGHDVQREDFTVMGIGDMSGDVFGNGMLLSRHLRLLGAFNHREIFIDPDPDPEASWEERRRLFELPGSSWSDYDRGRLSEGGGVFNRAAKSIALSSQARAALDVEDQAMTPQELIRALLRMPVDLLWNGGIGTYVKASAETHADAGDKANDGVRVDATELRCRVVGEGGNLGLSQRARSEFATGGGRVNTDAIDNSAGVDCSDHEVNIKILLDAVVAKGDLGADRRNELLASMTDAVAELVLKDNYEQAETLSLAEAQAASMLDVHARLIDRLEQTRKLDRELEALPSEEELAERKRDHRGLTRPELATLLAYSKIDLYAALLDSDVPEDPYLSAELEAYFPTPLPQRFGAHMRSHPLRREIMATRVVNNMLHGAGITFAFRLHEETGAPASDIARAYTVAREVFEMRAQWAQIEGLDNRVDAETQTAMLLEGRRLVERGSRWLLRNRRRPLAIAAAVEDFGPGAAVLYASVPELLGPSDLEPLTSRAGELQAAGVPRDLALRVASLGPMAATFDIVEVARETGWDVEAVAAIHFRLGSRLQLHWLRDAIVALPRDDRWRALARAALRDDLYGLHRALTADVVRSAPAACDAEECVERWVAGAPAAERCLATLADIRVGRVYDLTTLPVAVREVRNLIQARESAPV
ncbi:MAG: NAD-glutamate dehydrogenase [Solirubrobacteraceae bacterium]